jgi:hypothetical protein
MTKQSQTKTRTGNSAVALESSASQKAITTNNLGKHLAGLHPANLYGVANVLCRWAEGEAKDEGMEAKNERSKILEDAAGLRAFLRGNYWQEFDHVLKDYAALLTAMDQYLWPFANQWDEGTEEMGDVSEENAYLAWEQIRRLAFNIGIDLTWGDDNPAISLDPIEHAFSTYDQSYLMDKALARALKV